jgi:hypothetical protein
LAREPWTKPGAKRSQQRIGVAQADVRRVRLRCDRRIKSAAAGVVPRRLKSHSNQIRTSFLMMCCGFLQSCLSLNSGRLTWNVYNTIPMFLPRPYDHVLNKTTGFGTVEMRNSLLIVRVKTVLKRKKGLRSGPIFLLVACHPRKML